MARDLFAEPRDLFAPQPVTQRETYGEPVQNADGSFAVGGGLTPGETAAAALDYPLGVGEAALSLGSGMVAGTVAPFAAKFAEVIERQRRAINSLAPNSVYGPQMRDQYQDALTYQPRTQTGQSMMQGYGELLAPVGEAIEKTRLGDEALEAGLPDWLAANAEAIPEYVGAAVAGLGLKQPVRQALRLEPKPYKELSTKGRRMDALKKGEVNTDAARYILDSKGKPIKYPLAEKAHAQGWSDDVIAIARDAGRNPATSKNTNEMFYITRRALKDPKWGATNRPHQVHGQSMMDRFQYIDDLNRQIGDQIDDVARQYLSGKQVDYRGILDAHNARVGKLGGKVVDGKLVFPKGARLYGQPSNQRALRIIQDQIDAMGDNPSAYQLHKLKQNVGDFVDYGTVPNTKTPISGKAESALKGLYADINKRLKGVSDNYDSVNTIFSDTKGAIKDAGKAFGKQLYGPNAEKATGTRLKRWISNATSREAVINAYHQLDDVARKYGGEFTDDIETQILLANALDDILTTPVRRTTFKAEGGKVVAEALERSTIHHIGTAVDKGIRWARGASDETALKALEDLIRAGQ